MQYSPRDSKAESRLHVGQLRGSLSESSGCGSRMILPSEVFFLSSDGGASLGGAAVGKDE